MIIKFSCGRKKVCLEKGCSLGYIQILFGRLTQRESATFTR